MDVAEEFRAVNYKIKLQARRSAIIAEAKMYNMTLEEYIEKLNAESKAAHERRMAEASDAAREGYESMGRMLRGINDAFISAAESFAKGWNSGSTRK